MVIEIDDIKFLNSKLTYNQWIYLQNITLGRIFPDTIHLGEVRDLESKGYVKVLDDNCSKVVAKDKSLQLFLSENTTFDTMFKTFWETYPLRVGSRVLRSKDANTKEATEIKKKMFAIFKVKGNFDKVMSGLTKELELRKKDNSLMYMQLITTYVNQHTWEKYYGLEEEVPVEKTESI